MARIPPATLAAHLYPSTLRQYTRSEVLSLYRRLVRAGQNRLVYTNPSFFQREVRRNFEKHRHRRDNALYYERGQWLLDGDMGGLR